MAKRKSVKRKGITTTVIVPKWQKDLRAFFKRAKRLGQQALMGAGLLAVLFVLMLAISRAMGGG